VSTALAAVAAIFPGATLTKSTLHRRPKVPDEIPPDAERVAVLEALRQAYALVSAQRRFILQPVEPALDAALSAIATVASTIKENS
jgi:hypothetical protein